MHFCRIAQCTMVRNVPCAWQFICKASSNTLCTLIVQTNSSTCNCETPQRHQDNLTTLLGHTSHWVWGTITGVQAPGNNIRWSKEVSIPFGQPTLLCSVTLLPFRSRNNATSAWPFAAALKSGVLPDCTCSEGDKMEPDGTEISTSNVLHQLVHMYTVYTIQQGSTTTVPMQQVCSERSQNASDKQHIMQANLIPCFHIKSTGSHEVLHHGQLALLGCPVQGCVSIIIRVKEVALHFWGKVLSNSKMATNSTSIKGIVSPLHWTTGTGSQQITTCAHMHAGGQRK